MNLSGKAIKYWLDKENIEKENMLVITDDLNLAFGTIRIKTKGSDGGHNGLKNIQLLLNSTEYPRYRFGISDAFKKGQQVDYVLGEWTEQEKEKLKERLDISSSRTEWIGLIFRYCIHIDATYLVIADMTHFTPKWSRQEQTQPSQLHNVAIKASSILHVLNHTFNLGFGRKPSLSDVQINI